jgi:hypothetical protein
MLPVGARSRLPVRLSLAIRLLAPAFFVVVAEKILPPATIAIALAIVAFLTSVLTTALARLGLEVFARERIRVTLQTLPAHVRVVAAVVAPEAPSFGAYALTKCRATQRAHTEHSKGAPGRRFHHLAATGLSSDITCEIVKTNSVHVFLPN